MDEPLRNAIKYSGTRVSPHVEILHAPAPPEQMYFAGDKWHGLRCGSAEKLFGVLPASIRSQAISRHCAGAHVADMRRIRLSGSYPVSGVLNSRKRLQSH